MNDTAGVAPPVQAVLEAARGREGGTSPLTVDGRGLSVSFRNARDDGRVPVIAEVKRSSPTTSQTRTVDPAEAARAMESAGAAAISVLTEPTQFDGSEDALREVRSAVSIPVLRKDFLLQEAHLDAVAADVVLLIVRFLDDLSGMIEAARDRGMEPLVEVHTRREMDRALAAGAEIIGVNNRDLAALEVDRSTVETLADSVPSSVTLVAESGIRTTDHANRMLDAGADGLLIGSAIMDDDIAENTRRFVQA